jgi:hypothetical protein
MKITPGYMTGNSGQTALNGLTKATEQAAAAAQRIVEGPIEAKDIVDLKVSEHAFKSSAAVLSADKRMHDRLLDILS